jgi:hypothetical protein
MCEINFTKGAEFWYAHYYEKLRIGCQNTKILADFGRYFSDFLNEEKEKLELSSLLRDIVREQYRKFDKLDEKYFDNLDFLKDEKIEYNKEFNYIRFPDFSSDRSTGILLRMDINPCIGDDDTMTKIYCNLRHRDNISEKDAYYFFKKSQPISNNIVEILTKRYVDSYTKYARINNYSIEEVDESAVREPFIVDSYMVGSNDEHMINYLKKLDNRSEWTEFCQKDETGKKLNEFLVKLNKSSIGKDWELSDYDWFKQKVVFEQKRDQAGKPQRYEALGYIGYHGDDNSCHLIGVSDSYPHDILLPLHLELIQSTVK